jgi:hypothetical protein
LHLKEIIAITKNMKAKLKFETPRVTQTVELCPEFDILGDSLENRATITSMGQEVQNYDLAGSSESAEGYSIYWE